MTFEPHEAEGPIVRDRRRIDPETGQLRKPQGAAAPGRPSESASPGTASSGVGSAGDGSAGDASAGDASGGEAADADPELARALAERTADLQRLQAEYVNYKRRVDRDREVVRDTAVVTVVTQLLPVLDDIGRAREHGELSGGFKAVADSLERTVSGLGLVSFGAVGDPFDPRVHEALMHSYSDDVDEPVAQMVLQVGYRIGDRIVRPARVAVAEPSEPAEPSERVKAPEPAPGADEPSESAYAGDAVIDDGSSASPGPEASGVERTDDTE